MSDEHFCNCDNCQTIREWEEALNIKTEEAKEAFEEMLIRLEDAETDSQVARLIFTGEWPGSVEILEAALEIAKKLRLEKGE